MLLKRTPRFALLALFPLFATPAAGAPPQAPDAEAQATDPNRPAAVTTESVPPVPDELLERLNQYQNVRSAALLSWSPDGNGILISTRFADTAQLHRVYQPGGRREQITFFDEPVGGTFVPHRDDQMILVSMDEGGNENDQIYRLENGRLVLLTDGASRNGIEAFGPEGRAAVISSNRRNGRDTDLYRLDLETGQSEMILEVDREFWGVADWSLDGSAMLLYRYVSINEVYPYIAAVESAEPLKLREIPIPGGVERAAFGDMAFTPDGRYAYITTDARGEFLELARLDLETMEYEWLTEDIDWDVEDVEVDENTGLLAFAINADGASRLYVRRDGENQPLDLPLGIVSGLDFSPDGSQLGFTLSRPDAPSDVYSIALDSPDLQAVRWTYSEVGGLDPASFVTPERISYESFDGLAVPAYYFRPRGASADDPVPVIISIHGGPEGQYRPYFGSMTQFYVNELGAAVLAPNVRGSAGYGKTYLQLDNATLREDSVRDIGALLDWIAEQPELDAERVAVVGGSYGGYMVLASLVHFGERIRAGVDIVGIANFVTFLENTADYRRDLRRAEYGDERDPEIRAFFERISPSNRVDEIQSALLVAHGVNDPRVPFSEAEQIARRVREAGHDVWTVYADNEGHGFARRENADYLQAVVVMFLEDQLARDASSSTKTDPPASQGAGRAARRSF